MRPIRRQTTTHHFRSQFLLALASSLCIAACSVPDIRFHKETRLAADSPVANFTTGGNPTGKDKRYLTSVHIRFSESKDIAPLSFDIRRDRKMPIVARLWESEETLTTLGLGYSGGEGPRIKCRFSWRF